MTIEMLDGKICNRRIDYIDSILYDPKTSLCQIWYNYEPDHATKNYRSSLHTFDKPSFQALLHAWKTGASVVLKETPGRKKIAVNQETQHEMFRGSV
jgi:hypothetical protein